MATTVKVAAWPALTATLCGWVVMLGAKGAEDAPWTVTVVDPLTLAPAALVATALIVCVPPAVGAV